MKKIIKNIFVALLFIIGVELIGFLSSLLSGDVKSVYANLVKPPLSPPSVIFGIVWPILFALIGLSLFFVWKNKPKNAKEIYIVSAFQLLLNFLWPILFFRFNLRIAALIDIIFLIAAVGYLLYLCYKEIKVSFYLLLPYFAWLIFAMYLNIGFIVLN